ncbi:Transcriptional adapter ada2 [Coemansia sp. RSA 2336]|nr:Transcriptional adapter ada2 [Coemansia sp. RSA 2336]
MKNGKPAQGLAQEVGQKFHCDNCQANVTDGVRISCCHCPEFDLCTTCFSQGVELGSHANDHPYRVVTRNHFSIYAEDWTADEELLLIDGLRQFGMGNWKDAAEHIGTKTKEQCEQHYLDIYVASPAWPLPEDKIKPALPIPKKQSIKVLSSQPSNHEIAGYMPGRLEFETEWENDAEQVVKDMIITDDDTPEEQELKLTVLRIYNHKLDRRADRKQFIFDRGLLDYRKTKHPKEERELLTKTKVFAQMQTKADYEEFTAGLLNEHNLRQRIAQLQEWRRQGITTLKDGAQYEVERSQRLSRRSTTQRDSIHLLERLYKLAKPKASHDLLCDREKKLCVELGISWRLYMAIKEAWLAEYMGWSSLEQMLQQQQQLTADQTHKIYNFFIENNWIKKL